MRFLLASVVCLFFVCVSSENVTTAAPTVAPVVVDSCSFANKSNPTIYWDRENILNPAKIDKPVCNCDPAVTTTQVPTTTEGLCPEGWINYESSCYWYSDSSSSMTGAVDDCEKKNATLFVANTRKEWDVITSDNNKNMYNWIGLQKENSELDAEWQAEEAMSVYELPLLLKDQKDLRMNGWSDSARCAASFNIAVDTGKYAYFYPCEFKFNFICERNATIYHNYPCVNDNFKRM